MAINFKVGINKLGLIVGLIGLLFCAALGVWWILQPSWQPILDSAKSPQSRLEIRNKLMEWGQSFKEDPETGNILVRDTDLLALRAKLSANGIPEERSPGLEIFSEAEYGMSEFTQRINYQRAIESEIANTIRSFADVNSARVHLTIPKQSIFRDEKSVPKASVTIKPKPGQTLTKAQVHGISKLVAASIDGLDPASVIILNNYGEVISANAEDPNQELKQSKFDAERYYAQKARELVHGIAHTDDIKISVNVIYNFDKVKSIREQFLPKAPGEFGHILKSKHQITKSTDENNLNASTNTITEEEYLYSKERSEIEHAPGEIQKLSIGIVVMRRLPQETINSIINVVTSGLGMDTSRGDTITVVAIPGESLANDEKSSVDKKGNSEKSSSVSAAQGDNISLKIESSYFVIGAIAAVLAVLLLIFLIVITKRGNKKLYAPRLSKHEQEAFLLELKQWLHKHPSSKSTDA